MPYDGRSVSATHHQIDLQTPSANYPIHIGPDLLVTLAPRLRKLTGFKSHSPRLFLVTSPEIWKLWSTTVLSSFPADGQPTVLLVPSGERHKRLPTVERLLEELAQAGADRGSVLLALGGGVLGDITGFVAAIYMRGIRYIQLPTTLLAQVDSAVGGKTGVNLAAGKNLAGSFHHPLAVFADTGTLGTLPPRELRAGLQESIKAGIIGSPELFHLLETRSDAILHPEHPEHADLLNRAVTASVGVKAGIVAADERESDLRMTLNFGHTLGHAIEAATGYRQLLHGEAVGWGSIAACHLSRERGLLSVEQAGRIERAILLYGPLPPFVATAERLVDRTASDKKNVSGKLSFVVATGIGSVEVVQDVTHAELLSAAESMLHLMRRQPKPPAQP